MAFKKTCVGLGGRGEDLTKGTDVYDSGSCRTVNVLPLKQIPVGIWCVCVTEYVYIYSIHIYDTVGPCTLA